MAYPIKEILCSGEGCVNTYRPHYWGSREAARRGWFLQRDKTAWCPDHIPSWVSEWRQRQIEKKEI
jgi:hypothetical protein